MKGPENDPVGETESYPPRTSYTWVPFTSLPQELKDPVNTYFSNNLPGNEPRDILQMDGLDEEASMTNLLTELTVRRLMNLTDYPKAEEIINRTTDPNVISYHTHEVSACAGLDAKLNNSEGGNGKNIIIFHRYKNATQDQYTVARSMILRELNALLAKLRRQPIPPLP